MPGLFKPLLLHLLHMTTNTLKMEAAFSCETFGTICRNTWIRNFMQIFAASACHITIISIEHAALYQQDSTSLQTLSLRTRILAVDIFIAITRLVCSVVCFSLHLASRYYCSTWKRNEKRFPSNPVLVTDQKSAYHSKLPNICSFKNNTK